MPEINLVVQHKATGQAWDISALARSVRYETNLRGAPGKLTVDLIGEANTQNITIANGDVLYLIVNQQRIFWGFVFTISTNRWGEINVIAYDQLRYLKSRGSYIFKGATTGDIITKIGKDFSLHVGNLIDTGYKHPTLVEEDKSLLDIISHSIDLTVKNTSNTYVFYDDFGLLRLSKPEGIIPVNTSVLIGPGSLLKDYTFKQDIDSDTYNVIKLVRPNKKTGRADVVVYRDNDKLGNASTIGQWGVLQKYDKVDEKMSLAEMSERAKRMLDYYDRVLQTLSVQTVGVVGVRAGALLAIDVPDLDIFNPSKLMIMDTVVHEFIDNDHQMGLEMRVLA